MAWSSLSERFSSLPLLLAGPIIRRAETTNVSVWFVLKENRDVTLNIFDIDGDPLATTPILTLSGTQTSGVNIGNHVFVYCITATGVNNRELARRRNYYYDIDFGENDLLSKMIDEGLDLTYDGSNLPSFALSPDIYGLNEVRLVHGSCRKPHGEGFDAMEGLDEMIKTAVSDYDQKINAADRPHQLFLTGDQIYADDVSDVLLFMIDDAAKKLFGWDEDYSPFTEEELKPGNRNTNDRMRNDVGFTGMLPKNPKYSKSHLLKFREYATMYLFVWSDVLWAETTDIPTYDEVYTDGYMTVGYITVEMGHDHNYTIEQVKIFDYFDTERQHLINFQSTLVNVRKALANIPTYMMFDDHEVTDDWNLNWRWCKEVYSKSLGRKTVQNGLLAFALFQAWGNTPDRFKNGTNGGDLLYHAELWRGAEDSRFDELKTLLNVPTLDPNAAISEFPYYENRIDWHFDYQSIQYAVYFQDSRTWRSYPNKGSDIDFANLISEAAYSHQLPETFPNKELILIVAPCPVIGEPFIEEEVQIKTTTWEERCEIDTEAWALAEFGLEKLFSALASRLPVVATGTSRQRSGRLAFLSGDVHYGFSARCQIWGNTFINDHEPGINTDVIFAQLTASSFKNQTFGLTGAAAIVKNGTITLHKEGYPVGIRSTVLYWEELPEPVQKYVWLVDNSNSILGKFDAGSMFTDLQDYQPVLNGLLVKRYEDLEKDSVKEINVEPNWRSRIDWILGERGEDGSPSKVNSAIPSKSEYLQMVKDCNSYANKWGAGKEIVGVNNLGEIKFAYTWDDDGFRTDQLLINQILWWRMEPETGTDPLQLFPLTTFTIPMNITGDTNHLDESIEKPTFNGL